MPSKSEKQRKMSERQLAAKPKKGKKGKGY